MRTVTSLNKNIRHFLQHTSLILAFISLSASLSFGQGVACGCQDNVIVTLDENCQFELTIENVKAGPCRSTDVVRVSDGNPGNDNIIDCPGTFEYGVFRGEELVCWGNVTAEDKSGPIPVDTIQHFDTLECHLIDPILNNPNSIDPDHKYYIGEVLFRDNCSACSCIVSRTFSDQLNYANCTDVSRTGVYAEMTREWTAVDCEGYRTQVSQKFIFVRPSLDSLRQVPDTTYQSCTPEDVVILTQYPYWVDVFGDKIHVNEVDCDYAATIEQREFETCVDGSFKQENYVRVFDWCEGGARYVDTFLVKVGDFAGPVFTGNAQNVEGDILQQLTDNVDRDSLFAVREAGKLPVISTGPMDCTAALSLQLEALKLNFDFDLIDCAIPEISVRFYSFLAETFFDFRTGDTLWMETNYPNFNELATGIPVGIHAMVIEASDGCESTSTGLLYFIVKDQIAPVMKCDDELTVSLTTSDPDAIDNEAYARLDAVDVDEGSWDNCDLGFIKIRRGIEDLEDCESVFLKYGYDGNRDGKIDENDWFDENNNGIFDPESEFKWELVDGVWFTPWRDYVEFFCCDVDRAIIIELGGWDNARDPLSLMRMRNHNICWQTTVVEDSSIPNLTPLPTLFIKCTDEITERIVEGPIQSPLLEEVRAAFGETVPFGIFCGDIVLNERFEDHRDRCGFGRIDRIIDVEKMTFNKGTQVATIVQQIFVKEVFDYSICFPEDVAYHCETGPDTIPGMTYESNGCDLIATFVDDEQFDAIGDVDACFKIFRTYSLINWCEYDGESPPVIVSRDWDNYNGCSAGDEYNINPERPDGDNLPGDEGICVIIKRDFQDNLRDVVYYDRNNDPFDNIPDDPSTSRTEGYWWKVVSGSSNPDLEAYYEGGYLCSSDGVWNRDTNDNGSADDDDFRYGSLGFWKYTQHIKVTDGEAPELSLICADTVAISNNLDCTALIEVTVRASDNCTDGVRSIALLDMNNDGGILTDISNELVDSSLTLRLPLGTHRIEVRSRDICGNTTIRDKVVTIVDRTGPSPICLSGLIVELMPRIDGGGATAVWATDFIGSPIGDCTGQGPELAPVNSVVNLPIVTDYSINRVGDTPVRDSTGLIVTCDDLGLLVPVEMHAWDEAGNNGFCTTFIEVQDNQGLCSQAPAGEIAGLVTTENFDRVQDVEIELSGLNKLSYSTQADGSFRFKNVAEGNDYTIIPKNDKNAKNGISTLDLILITRHIIGVKRLDSPYKMIAADINRSGGISTLDLIQLRKIILNIETEFANNTSWRFVDADYIFPDESNPWKTYFPEIKNINNLKGDPVVNFVAIKVGDVNYSARFNDAQASDPRTTTSTLIVSAQDSWVEEGQEYEVYFAADLSETSGYQFALAADQNQLEIIDLIEGITKSEHFGIFADEGRISTSYNTENTGIGKNHLFGLRVRAKESGLLSEFLSLDHTLLSGEAYDQNAKDMALVLQWDSNVKEENQLLQNFPNPFSERTQIGFYLESNSKLSLQVQDVKGRIVHSIQGDYSKGYHQLSISKDDLPANGLYFYRLITDEFEETKQLILQR